MSVVVASAPGKLAVLGEYAVLDGAPALVLAVNRRCECRIGPRDGAESSLETRFPEPRHVRFGPGRSSGIRLVDVVREAVAADDARAFEAVLDSRELFAGERKLGLGSSAAALCAWAAAFSAWQQLSNARSAGRAAAGTTALPLPFLIDLHRRFQGGTGSGLDVAAAVSGGAVEFRLTGAGLPQVGSVQLPNGVGFAGIFAGKSASTPDLIGRYRRFRLDRPKEAAEQQRIMADVAEAGCAALQRGDRKELLSAVDRYGRELDSLGQAIGADIVTAEHHAIGRCAQRFGVTYKVSGAGGGDLGIALSSEPEALEKFGHAVREKGFEVVDLRLDRRGLVVEELT